jgi:hypothetical protein
MRLQNQILESLLQRALKTDTFLSTKNIELGNRAYTIFLVAMDANVNV